MQNLCSLGENMKIKLTIIVYRLSVNVIRDVLFTDFPWTTPTMLKVKVGLMVEFGDFKQTKYDLKKFEAVSKN